MMTLTDSQLILLSTAAERDDGAAVVPDQMKKAGATKVASSLVARKLMREIRAKPAMPIWREDDDGRRMSLIITRAGRDAIGVAVDAGEAEPPAATTSSNPKPVEAECPAPSGSPRTGSK